MNKRQQKALERFRQIKAFVSVHRLEGSRWATLQREFPAAFAEIEALQVEQGMRTGSRHSHARITANLRRKLRWGHMLPIRRDARLLLGKEPGLATAIVVPHATANSAALVAAAQRMAKGLAAYRRYLESHGVPVGFLASLRGAARDLATAIKDAPLVVGRRTAATATIREKFSRLSALEARVDGQVMAAATTNRELWRLWKSAKKTPKRRGRPPKLKT